MISDHRNQDFKSTINNGTLDNNSNRRTQLALADFGAANFAAVSAVDL